MFSVKKALTNTRIVPDQKPQLIATPTSGIVRLNATAVDKLGVTELNYLVVVEVKDDEGKSHVGIYVSPYGLKRNEAGDVIGETTTDEETGKTSFSPTVFVINPEINTNARPDRGQKLGYANGKNGSMQFSSQAVYTLMGGNEEESQIFDIPALDGDDMMKFEDAGAIIYVLRFGGSQPKAERKSSEEEQD